MSKFKRDDVVHLETRKWGPREVTILGVGTDPRIDNQVVYTYKFTLNGAKRTLVTGLSPEWRFGEKVTPK